MKSPAFAPAKILIRIAVGAYILGAIPLWVSAKFEFKDNKAKVASEPAAPPAKDLQNASEADIPARPPEPAAPSIPFYLPAPSLAATKEPLLPAAIEVSRPPPAKPAANEDTVREFVRRAIENENSRTTERTRQFYASWVDYGEDTGGISVEKVIEDKQRYFEQYPSGWERIIGIINVDLRGSANCEARFSTEFEATDRLRNVRRGTVLQTWEMTRNESKGSWEITRQRLKVTLNGASSSKVTQPLANPKPAKPSPKVQPSVKKAEPKDWRKNAEDFERR